jgi:signal transduction histidine kinase
MAPFRHGGGPRVACFSPIVASPVLLRTLTGHEPPPGAALALAVRERCADHGVVADLQALPLLAFARAIQGAGSYRELFEITLAEVKRACGYGTIWFAWRESEDDEFLRILDIVGAASESIRDAAQRVPLAGDAMISEVLSTANIVVVEDARTDPRTNKVVVAALGNRTIINIPLAVVDKPFGTLGIGTFGDEGCRPPTPEMLQHLSAISGFLSVAKSRLYLLELERANERKRREVDQRLAHAQRLDSLGVLAGGVAHDFNNLLTVLLAATSLAKRASTPAGIAHELDLIENAVTRGQALTHQLLAMSRGQALRLNEVDAMELVEQLVPLLRRVIPSTISIELIGSALGALVEADRTQLDQVVMNLCLNARDAMPEGGRLVIEAEVVLVNTAFREVHPWAKEGRYVLVSVSDTGHGIPKEHIDRIFDPFFSTKGEQAGTGLGLTVAYGIVKQHGGMLHCYSEVGVGTTFKIYLPVAARAARSVGPKLYPRISGGRERVLVGEDDADVRAVACRILESAGYQVSVATSGEDVVRAVAAEAFDLLLLDVIMPGLHCPDTLAQVRRARPELRIVLATGYAAETDVAGLLRDQGVPILPKPYDPDALLRAVRGELDRS